MRLDVYVTRQNGYEGATKEVVEQAVGEAGVGEVEINVIEVDGPEDARLKKVFGAPTIRVNGIDIEYGEREPEETTAGVRYYSTPDGWKPVPARGMIVRALKSAKAREGATRP